MILSCKSSRQKKDGVECIEPPTSQLERSELTGWPTFFTGGYLLLHLLLAADDACQSLFVAIHKEHRTDILFARNYCCS